MAELKTMWVSVVEWVLVMEWGRDWEPSHISRMAEVDELEVAHALLMWNAAEHALEAAMRASDARSTPGPRIRAVAFKVLEFISAADSVDEASTRRAIGDSPDCSKALRCLLAAGLVRRLPQFTGGRGSAFRYAVEQRC